MSRRGAFVDIEPCLRKAQRFQEVAPLSLTAWKACNTIRALSEQRRTDAGVSFRTAPWGEVAMEKTADPIVRALLKESEAFRREKEGHQRYEKILEEFNRRPHLTPDEEMERKKIQKLKLAGKDRMERMILVYKRSRGENPGGRQP